MILKTDKMFKNNLLLFLNKYICYYSIDVIFSEKEVIVKYEK